MNKTIFFSTEHSEYFARRVADCFNLPVTPMERRPFKGGERYYRIGISDRMDLMGRTAIFVGSTHTDEDLLELYRVGCALAGYGSSRRIFVIPFLGYSTMERAVKPGEIVTAKTVARMLSTIPNSGMGNVFLFLDLHVSGLVHYFEGNCLRYELYAQKPLIAAIKGLRLNPENMVFGSADLGRPAWVRAFAKHFGTKIAVIDKTREGEETEVEYVVGDVRDKDVVIYDDMSRSSLSLAKAAKAYLADGAREVYAVLSHLALNDAEAVRQLTDSPIRKIITTNSHPMSQNSSLDKDRFVVVDVCEIFAQAIQRLL
jgi:ribose-phosphate pyrophosphokinase